MNQVTTRSMPPIRGVLFDAYGTLLDVFSVAALADQLFPGQGNALALLWRQKQLEYSWLRTLGQRYKPFWDVTGDALRNACARLDLALSPPLEQQLMAQYAKLTAYPECRDVLIPLRQYGLTLGVLSNGDPAMLRRSFDSAAMTGLLDHLLSVDAIQQFKVTPAAYELGTKALSLAANEILFVSSNGWDAIGATWFGYRVLWLNRLRQPLDELDTKPEAVGYDLRDVLSLVARDRG
jgi:2-haloacid dehalogenase